MTMGLVNINNSSKWANVDLASAQKVTEQIFQRAQNNATINTSRVAQVREIQGVDFYSRATSIEAQRQIAISNLGLNVQTPNQIGTLNSLAAMNTYKTDAAKAVNGNMTVSISEGVSKEFETKFTPDSMMEVFQTNKDKKGSNPFSYEGQASAQNNETIETEGASLSFIC